MTSQEILEKYFALYKKNGHTQVPNMNLVPEGDSTLLFVNSGMFPLVPYLGGEMHPLGKRLMSVQRSVRLIDFDEVGDNRHTTAFHMIGNWSLGDYFKKEQLPWIYGYFIDELGLDPHRLYATVFEGDEYAPKDTESIQILTEVFKSYGIEATEGVRIFPCGRDDNWWQRGEAVGELGGPDSEIFYYLGEGTGEGKHPAQHQDEFLEIGNSVFMQYRKTQEGGWAELEQKNIDFGGGLERIAMAVQHKQDIFETDNFYPLIQKLEELSGRRYHQDEETTRAMRIIADHIRAATFLTMDGVLPSNKDQGYVLRRYLRRLVRYARKIGITSTLAPLLIPTTVQLFSWLYPELVEKEKNITVTCVGEEERFQQALERGEAEVSRQLAHRGNTSSLPDLVALAFTLYQSYGYPPDLFAEDLKDNSITIDYDKFTIEFDALRLTHQETSRKGADQKFKGGLADHSEEVVRYHTATHLLHTALRRVLGTYVQQYGSNITADRLRFDFSHGDKLTDTEIRDVETVVNDIIKQKLPVNFVMLPKEEAQKSGALHFFKEKYGEQVKVYYIGESLEGAVSKEFCGGPHVKNLSELSPTLTIYKQESVGKGVRRLYAHFT